MRILAPGTAPVPEPADVAPEPTAAPPGPVRTRETASDGYRRALAAHRQAAPPHRTDPDIPAAVERQTAALRARSAHAFPDIWTPDMGTAHITTETARILCRRQAATTGAAALRRARAERAGPPRTAGQAA
ncbi:hypothetical protein [Streptomyces sp. PTD5-9]|uniref:hypothetical protein n=1 Tax=Streptomyces sp. PTD5-9 TaxID=3120150 RepID=UPI00300B350E